MHLNQSPIQEQRGHKGWPVETWTVGGSGGWKEERKNQESPMGRTPLASSIWCCVGGDKSRMHPRVKPGNLSESHSRFR